MEIRELSFYQDFTCAGGACPETCCRGWVIPLNKEDYERFRQTKGLTGWKLKLSMSGIYYPDGDTDGCLNASSGSCSFHDRRGLCSLQRRYGHGFLPEACRMYPRFYRNYGVFEERCLDLSCMEAAGLFLKNRDALFFNCHEGDSLSSPCSTNDDTAYLQMLVRTRDRMKEALLGVRDLTSLKEVLSLVDAYAVRTQDSFLKGETDYLAKHPFGEDPSPELPEVFPFPASRYDALMGTSFYHPRLSSRIPFLYHLCGLYFYGFKRKMGEQGLWVEWCEEFFSANPEYARIYGAWYAYYLLQFYLKCYEDYSFVRNIRLGIIHLNMIFFFHVLYRRKNAHLSEEECARIMSVYHRRAFFSDDILNAMYEAYTE